MFCQGRLSQTCPTIKSASETCRYLVVSSHWYAYNSLAVLTSNRLKYISNNISIGVWSKYLHSKYFLRPSFIVQMHLHARVTFTKANSRLPRGRYVKKNNYLSVIGSNTWRKKLKGCSVPWGVSHEDLTWFQFLANASCTRCPRAMDGIKFIHRTQCRIENYIL